MGSSVLSFASVFPFQADRRTVTSKKGNQVEKCEVRVFDDTADASLVLWGSSTISATQWKPSFTILLLSNPTLMGDSRPMLNLNSTTLVDVDPLFSDACWLRGYAERQEKREHVNQPFPQDGEDVIALCLRSLSL